MNLSAQPLADGAAGDARDALIARLIERERVLRSILDHAPIGIWLTHASGRLEFVNKTFCDAVGIPEEKFLAVSTYAALYDAEAAQHYQASDAAALAQSGPYSTEETVLFADGQQHDVHIVKVRLEDAQGNPTGKLIGLSMDVTARKQAEKRSALLSSAVDHANEGIVITDLAGRIVDINPRFTAITGYTREEAIGQNPRLLKSDRQDDTFYAAMWQSISIHGHWAGEVWNRRKNGEVYPQLLSIGRVDDAAGNPLNYIGIFFELTEMKKALARVEHMAHHDALTQLPNRILFADRLDVALAQSQRSGCKLAVCFLDLDGFKPINDRFGHQYGDVLLVETAQRLTQSLRGGDSVARIGGDEFVLLINELQSMDECDVILERLLRTIAAPVILDGQSVSVTGSLGVTLYPEDDSDADTLLRHADQSLYRAKEAGKNRYHVFDALHDYEARVRQAGRTRFEAALAAGHLVLYYQPKVDMRFGRVIGAEALIRWNDPDAGLLSPAQFLPFIDNTPADVALGEWVLEEALRQSTVWHRAGFDLAISVNISAYHLAQPGFAQRLKLCLDRHPDLPPHALEIEILETAALGDIAHVVTLIAECRVLGVGFALDDFGTGYSSLSYFKRLPISTLKIDQGFVRDMLHDDDDLAIVEGVISLSRAFRRAVIAEGVETTDHGVRLLQMGCDLAQGYGIARPMPAGDFIAWHAAWQPPEAWTLAAGVDSAPHIDTLMVAADDHQRWLNEVKQYLESLPSEAQTVANLNPGHCRLGQWLAGIGHERFGHFPKFKALHLAHEQSHAAANELIALHRQGKSVACRLRLTELEKLSESVMSGLHTLLIDVSMH